MNTNGFIISASGRISIIANSRSYTVPADHPNYESIKDALKNGNYDLVAELANIPQTIKNRFKHENVTVLEDGTVQFRGNILHNVITMRILEFMRNGEKFEPLVAFLNNLMENPSGRAVNELYGFLEHGGFPITEDGCFIAYKGVTDEFKDKHTRTFDNSVGAVHEIPRNNVDDDCTRACSYGFHVGTLNYASQFAGSDGRLMLVKVNPRDAVSVPLDHDCEKLRVCRYEVVAESQDRARLEKPVYVSSFDSDEDDVDDESTWSYNDDRDFEDEYCS